MPVLNKTPAEELDPRNQDGPENSALEANLDGMTMSDAARAEFDEIADEYNERMANSFNQKEAKREFSNQISDFLVGVFSAARGSAEDGGDFDSDLFEDGLKLMLKSRELLDDHPEDIAKQPFARRVVGQLIQKVVDVSKDARAFISSKPNRPKNDALHKFKQYHHHGLKADVETEMENAFLQQDAEELEAAGKTQSVKALQRFTPDSLIILASLNSDYKQRILEGYQFGKHETTDEASDAFENSDRPIALAGLMLEGMVTSDSQSEPEAMPAIAKLLQLDIDKLDDMVAMWLENRGSLDAVEANAGAIMTKSKQVDVLRRQIAKNMDVIERIQGLGGHINELRDRFNIRNFARYSPKALVAQLNNKKPVEVLQFTGAPDSDGKLDLAQKTGRNMTDGKVTVFAEATTDDEIKRVIDDIEFADDSTLLIEGHGDPDGINLGVNRTSKKSRLGIDGLNGVEHQIDIYKRLPDDAKVVLITCDVGAPDGYANAISDQTGHEASAFNFIPRASAA